MPKLLYQLSPRYPFPGVRQHALANSFPDFCSFYVSRDGRKSIRRLGGIDTCLSKFNLWYSGVMIR